jgi:nitroreductase
MIIRRRTMLSVLKKNEALTPVGMYEEGMNWNAVEQVIFERRSIRAFKKEPVPNVMIRRILEAGRFAPSAGNMQPWKFIVVKSPEILAEMEKECVKTCKFIMGLSDYTRGGKLRRALTKPLATMFIRSNPNGMNPVPFSLMSQIAQGRAPVFHGAPTLILLMENIHGVAPKYDIGICGQNMVLTAHSMGLGTCWVGLVQLLSYSKKWKKFFNVEHPFELNQCIAVGWPKWRADGTVPREVQLVQWFEGGMEDQPRIEQQGV